MKKFFTFAAAVLFAFNVAATQKITIYVEEFEAASSVDDEIAEKVRAHVLTALSKFSHLQIIDEDSEFSVEWEEKRRQQEQSLSDATARQEMKQLGANFILRGKVLSFDVTETVNDNNEKYYKTTMTYNIQAVNSEDGTTVANQTIKYDGSGNIVDMRYGFAKTEEESEKKLYTYIKDDIAKFVTKNFALEGQVLASDYELDKKGKKVTACYIGLGSDDGVDANTKFDVFAGKMVAGRAATSKLDVILEVKEVVAGDLARCKVTKGGEVLKKALEDYAAIKAEDPEHALPVTIKMREKKIDPTGFTDMFKK